MRKQIVKNNFFSNENKKYLYNRNIKYLLDNNEMNIEMYKSLTNKELLTDENKLKIAKVLVVEDFNIAGELIKNINKEKYDLESCVVEKMINEQKIYNELSEDQKKIFAKAKEMGKMYLEIKNFREAYDWYTMGLYVTKHPVFYYYIGKTFYKLGKNLEARSWFNDYRVCGGEKFTKSMLYLGKIYQNWNNIDKALKLFSTADIIDETLGNSNHYKIVYNLHKEKSKII